MKILFDTNTPAPLRHVLRGHEIVLAVERGWDRLHNGALLTAAEGDGFDLLLTCDQNMQYQQNFTNRRIAVLVLSTNDWPSLRRAAAQISSAVDFVRGGQVTRVSVEVL